MVFALADPDPVAPAPGAHPGVAVSQVPNEHPLKTAQSVSFAQDAQGTLFLSSPAQAKFEIGEGLGARYKGRKKGNQVLTQHFDLVFPRVFMNGLCPCRP